ncbi:MAG TPA: transcriptional regulator BetI [Terriglobia bacterium]|nr:transcriptional regulator BetI [Terriglobia bacterium]
MPKIGMEEIRRRQLIEATIASIHEVGFADSSLSRISARAGVSTGIVHHYFEDKADLLEATLRQLGNNLHEAVVSRLAAATSPIDRLLAVIDGNLGPELYTPEGVSAWLAFWAQVPNNDRLGRVQRIIIGRLHDNLVAALRPLAPAGEVAAIAKLIASLIDGLWLRAALQPETPDCVADRNLVIDYLNAKLKLNIAVEHESNE